MATSDKANTATSQYIRDLRSFKIQFKFEMAVWFDSKRSGQYKNFQIEPAVPAPLLVVSLVKRLNH